MKILASACLALLWSATGAVAQSSLSAEIDKAAATISAASALLEQVDGADDQVLALGSTITAFENGLRILRDASRAAALRQARLTSEYDGRRDELSRLLGVLHAVESKPAPLLFMHPGGPLAAVQTAQLFAEAMPVLRARSDALRGQIAAITALESLRGQASVNLRDGLAGLLNARAALEDAMAQGDPVPALFVEDRMQVQILAATSDSMAAFALALSALPLPPMDSSQEIRPGQGYRFPVAGTVKVPFDEPDPSGLRRPGLIIAAAPLALVSAPFDATIRYAGPFLDYGTVVILEPEAGTLIVLAGIGRLFRAEGDVLTKGDPIGLLGGKETVAEEFLIEASAETDVQLQETLYIELRKDGESVDPAPWFTQE